MAPSPSGKAGACKASIPSSNLGGASKLTIERPYMENWQSWSNAPDLKSGEGSNLPRVRIPGSPPLHFKTLRNYLYNELSKDNKSSYFKKVIPM